MGNAIIVTLYTHRGCPGGDAAIEYLMANGVWHQVRDVIQEKEALAEFRRLGGIGTPLLLIGTHVMHGFDPVEFEQLAGLAGERGADCG